MSDNYDNWLDILPEEILYKIYFRNVMNDINNLFYDLTYNTTCFSYNRIYYRGFFLKKPLYNISGRTSAGDYTDYYDKEDYNNYNYNLDITLPPDYYNYKKNTQRGSCFKHEDTIANKLFSVVWLRMIWITNMYMICNTPYYSIKEIKQVCRDNGIKGYSNKKRPELYKLILNCKTL